MKNIETSIRIKATKEQVWDCLMSFENYSNWNPFIIKISGNSSKGGKLDVYLKNGEQKSMNFKPIVLENRLNEVFRWKGKLLFKGLFDGEHYFKIVECENGIVKFIHGENFSGLFSGLILKMIGEETKQGFEKMNEALKVLVEE